MQLMNRVVVAPLFVGGVLWIGACNTEPPADFGAGRPAAATAGLATKATATMSSGERLPPDEAGRLIDEQSPEHQRARAQAEVLALRTAVATQRKVLARVQPSRPSARDRAAIDAEIGVRRTRLAERERLLEAAEAAARAAASDRRRSDALD